MTSLGLVWFYRQDTLPCASSLPNFLLAMARLSSQCHFSLSLIPSLAPSVSESLPFVVSVSCSTHPSNIVTNNIIT